MRRAVPLVMVASFAAAMLGVTSAPASASGKSSLPLRRTNWVLTDRVSIGAALDGVAVNAVFGADRVEGSSGCNGYSSSYSTHGSRMTITNDGVSTLIACDGAAGQVEPKYLATLERVGRWRISGATLTLSTRAGRRLLVYRASVGTEALRGAWEVTSLSTGEAIASPIQGTAPTLEFAKKEVSGDGGCNTFSGPYAVHGADAIDIGPLKSARRGCAVAGADTQEQQYLAALGLARAYRVTGDRLTLYRKGGTIAVTARRPPNPEPASPGAKNRAETTPVR